jgi:hypothetical protein
VNIATIETIADRERAESLHGHSREIGLLVLAARHDRETALRLCDEIEARCPTNPPSPTIAAVREFFGAAKAPTTDDLLEVIP